MENLEVIELYENANHEKSKTFIDAAESTLKVQTEKKYITRDIEWINMMEEVIPHIDSIFRSPNRFIKNEEAWGGSGSRDSHRLFRCFDGGVSAGGQSYNYD